MSIKHTDTSRPAATRSRLTLTRRSALAAGAAAAALPFATRFAIAQARRKVTIVYGVQTTDISDAFFSSIPIGLGFYAEEGLDVEIQTVAGASAAVNLVASGRAEFSTHGTAGLFAAVGRGVPIKGFICQIPDYFVSIAVPKDSPVQSFDQLRGKVIGVNANGGAPHLVTRAVLRRMGWNPDTDVEFLAVGTGLPALDAIRRGRVQALALWDSVFAVLEFNGAQLRYFRPDPIPQLGFTHTTNTLDSTIAQNPQMVAGLGRAMAKAICIMASAPTAELVKLHFRVFPGARPAGRSDADLVRQGELIQAARWPFMRLKQRVFDRTEKIGDATDAMISGHRDLLAEGRVIPAALPVERYFTRQFIDQFNAIDVPALIAKGRALRV